ncbi:MAG TPA: hypothetical protein VHD32_09855 [Candidatus Didemnitutus sp.]|nr:hypothetical protein [Candidatus Didemnitutus sp.]
MNTPTISIAGQTGRIFEGEVPETFCFVPQDCIQDDGDAVRVEELDYVVSGWDVRNMRFNDRVEGRHLFPNVLRPVSDLGGAGVRVFLDRIQVIGAR